ncbi:MAG: phosphatase PAP2 family protein [Ilumatobacteraceae bacterium]
MPAHLQPEAAEHWILVHTAKHRRLNRLLRSADRRVFGGVAVVVCLVAVLIAAVTVGWILDTVESNRGFARWDSTVADWGAAHSSSLSTRVLRTVTHLGDTIVVVVAMGLVAAFDFRRFRNAGVIGFMVTVALGVNVLNNSLKWLVERERPGVAHLIGSAGSSFPSGHSAMAAAGWAAIALVLGRTWPHRRRQLAAGAVVIALTVATSRALLGVHWLTDVIAGVIVGWAWFFVVAVIFGGRLQRFGDPAVRDSRSLERSEPADLPADV